MGSFLGPNRVKALKAAAAMSDAMANCFYHIKAISLFSCSLFV